MKNCLLIPFGLLLLEYHSSCCICASSTNNWNRIKGLPGELLCLWRFFWFSKVGLLQVLLISLYIFGKFCYDLFLLDNSTSNRPLAAIYMYRMCLLACLACSCVCVCGGGGGTWECICVRACVWSSVFFVEIVLSLKLVFVCRHESEYYCTELE